MLINLVHYLVRFSIFVDLIGVEQTFVTQAERALGGLEWLVDSRELKVSSLPLSDLLESRWLPGKLL